MDDYGALVAVSGALVAVLITGLWTSARERRRRRLDRRNDAYVRYLSALTGRLIAIGGGSFSDRSVRTAYESAVSEIQFYAPKHIIRRVLLLDMRLTNWDGVNGTEYANIERYRRDLTRLTIADVNRIRWIEWLRRRRSSPADWGEYEARMIKDAPRKWERKLERERAAQP
ncbi:hypothetical protein [Nocardioides alpinus]|uniref:hypothetical protein n=1 Tax=Nocardioides alpinus TaxID=748909 RepID=UPI001E642FB4|nr:hypothetical protein [Nocardioides alpinus]